MFFSRPAGVKFVDRGDSESYDFITTDFIRDGTWREKDLSGIVPKNAVAVVLFMLLNANAANASMSFRKNGNTNVYNIQQVYTQVVDQLATYQVLIPLKSEAKVDYNASVDTWAVLYVAINGWFV